ncbi:MAG: hypothetical protein NTW58_05080 [Actinobacteria bacterium]|nr:hypothetical protein [Actinomycetota bacterium]
MSEQRNREILEGLFSDGKLRLSPREEYDIRSEDYVMEMPQSGERIVEFRDGRTAEETRYYASPFEAPARRAEWVEIVP